MTTSNKKRPVETLRDGALKAAIWKNEGDKGAFFNVTFARTYKDAKDNLKDTDSFSGAQLLRLARLAEQAYARTRELGQEERDADTAPQDPAPQDGAAEQQPVPEEVA